MANHSYWQRRIESATNSLFNKSQSQIDKQLRKYYKSIAQQAISDYEAVYNKILAQQADGKQITPADLYKLDTYWEKQAQLRQQLQKLGEKEISLLTKNFESTYFDTYHSISLKGMNIFNKLDNNIVNQVLNSVWCADGKTWSQRIWHNMSLLQETLDEGLIQCVAGGKSSSYLKKQLMERFNVSYSNADNIARTELAHIQTQAAQQRYKDYGIKQMEVMAERDSRTCKICEAHDGEIYNVTDTMPVPFHPRCRCCMLPVVEYSNKDKSFRALDSN